MEILVKGKSGSIWVQGGYMDWHGVPHILTTKIGEMIPVKKETVSLWIGKKDRFGRLIFENDVVRHTCEINDKPFTEEFVIYWDKELCGFLAKSTDKKVTLPADIDDLSGDVEIIGNVFDKKRKAKSVS